MPTNSPRRSTRPPQSRNRSPRNTQKQKRGGGRAMPTFDPTNYINRSPAPTAPAEAEQPSHAFTDFGFSDTLTRTLERLQLTTPTPIQDKAIPPILQGNDVIALAETGTGKTAAFLLPLIERTLQDPSRQTLILTPTRELAIQIEAELKRFARDTNLYWTTCVGGAGIGPQIRGLGKTNHFVIATPGRLMDLMRRGNYHADQVSTVVLDEADRMLDMGFIQDIRTILTKTPKARETHCFSATMPDGIAKLAGEFLREPTTVSVKRTDVTTSITQDIVSYRSPEKFSTLTQLLNDPAMERVLIFGQMKHSVDRLAKDLKKRGFTAETIHGNKSHPQRQRALKAFKQGDVQVLTATDVAARGIHVDGVSHVINYDLPQTKEDYVHRIGRTGRAHKTGTALTFVPKE